jgi:hypothetical protein
MWCFVVCCVWERLGIELKHGGKMLMRVKLLFIKVEYQLCVRRGGVLEFIWRRRRTCRVTLSEWLSGIVNPHLDVPFLNGPCFIKVGSCSIRNCCSCSLLIQNSWKPLWTILVYKLFKWSARVSVFLLLADNSFTNLKDSFCIILTMSKRISILPDSNPADPN